jgi:hypothetical protein
MTAVFGVAGRVSQPIPVQAPARSVRLNHVYTCGPFGGQSRRHRYQWRIHCRRANPHAIAHGWPARGKSDFSPVVDTCSICRIADREILGTVIELSFANMGLQTPGRQAPASAAPLSNLATRRSAATSAVPAESLAMPAPAIAT